MTTAKPIRYLIYDAETETHVLYDRKASPWHPDNWLVAEGWKTGDTSVQGNYYGKKRSFGSIGSLIDAYQPDFIVGHNIKFDLLWNMRDKANRDRYREFIANGGLIWDTQLAQYLLSGQSQEFWYNSLNELAALYGGTQKVDAVALLWQQGVQTSDIDKDLLLEYLLGKGDHLGDIGNTEKIFLAQIAKAKSSGQMRNIIVNMGALACSIEMEYNGMFVDKNKAYTQLYELKQDKLRCFQNLNGLLPKDLPFEFNWGSRVQLSCLIFGGVVSYKMRDTCYDDEGNPIYYKSGKKKGELKTSMQDRYYRFPGMVDPDPAWKGKNGNYSTGEEVLDQLPEDFEIIKDLKEFTRLNKAINTYYDNEDENPDKRKGMLLKVGDNGIIHHNINHTSTITGRLSSSNPNLQNLAKGDRCPIKSTFTSRFIKGKIIQSDFTSLEVYVQANESGDKALIEELRQGLDMHCMRVALKNHISYEEAYDLCKVKEDPKWKKERSNCKTFSFQRAYGAGANKIAQSTGMSEKEVKALIEAEEAKYTGVTKYFEEVMDSVKRSRQPTRNWQFHPEVRGMRINLGVGHFRARTGKVYTYQESPEPRAVAMRDGIGTSFSPTIIKNYSVQGEGAEQIKAAMWLALIAFYRRPDMEVYLVNQVHDALYLDANKPYIEESASILNACMIQSNVFTNLWYGIPVYAPVPTETVAGDDMSQEEYIAIDKSQEKVIDGIITDLLNTYAYLEK